MASRNSERCAEAIFLNFNLNGPIDVFVMSDDSNGPAYSPRSNSLNTNNPVITVPDKYGNLSNLARDSDVFFHEFTHHVLYRSVKPKTGSSQARSIQEGLADYFTYAMTGNNTLAESVQDGEPLRSATVETNISEETFAPNFDPYPAGVLLSSVLWKLRSNLAIGGTVIKSSIKLSGIRLISCPNSGHFIS